MSLLQLIENLQTDATVKVKDGDTDAILIEFKSGGIESVDDDVSARTVKRWIIDGSTAITVVLDVA